MDPKIYLKAGAALVVMGTVSFFVFDGLLGSQTKRREPVAAQALSDGGADYVHGTDAVTPITEPMALNRAPQRGTPFAHSYRITEDVGGRTYKNGLDQEGETRLTLVDGQWKAPSITKLSRQLPPDTWEPTPIAHADDAARCPADATAAPLAGALKFANGAPALVDLPPPLQTGDLVTGCLEIGRVLPLSAPSPVMTQATVKGLVTHRGRPAVLFEVSGRALGWTGLEGYSGYALVDRESAVVVFADIQATVTDTAAHGGYRAEARELSRVDLR